MKKFSTAFMTTFTIALTALAVACGSNDSQQEARLRLVDELTRPQTKDNIQNLRNTVEAAGLSTGVADMMLRNSLPFVSVNNSAAAFPTFTWEQPAGEGAQPFDINHTDIQFLGDVSSGGTQASQPGHLADLSDPQRCEDDVVGVADMGGSYKFVVMNLKPPGCSAAIPDIEATLTISGATGINYTWGTYDGFSIGVYSLNGQDYLLAIGQDNDTSEWRVWRVSWTPSTSTLAFVDSKPVCAGSQPASANAAQLDFVNGGGASFPLLAVPCMNSTADIMGLQDPVNMALSATVPTAPSVKALTPNVIGGYWGMIRNAGGTSLFCTRGGTPSVDPISASAADPREEKWNYTEYMALMVGPSAAGYIVPVTYEDGAGNRHLVTGNCEGVGGAQVLYDYTMPSASPFKLGISGFPSTTGGVVGPTQYRAMSNSDVDLATFTFDALGDIDTDTRQADHVNLGKWPGLYVSKWFAPFGDGPDGALVISSDPGPGETSIGIPLNGDYNLLDNSTPAAITHSTAVGYGVGVSASNTQVFGSNGSGPEWHLYLAPQ